MECVAWLRRLVSGFFALLVLIVASDPAENDFWQHVNYHENQACRGDTHTDNQASYYILASEKASASVGTCKAGCREMGDLCKGVEWSPGRCELWTRPEGIGATNGVNHFVCLRNDLAPIFLPQEGATDRACRGSHQDDNRHDYYTVVDRRSLNDCQNACMAFSGCVGMEYNGASRCEIWTRKEGIQAAKYLPGSTCMVYEADVTLVTEASTTAPPSEAMVTVMLGSSRYNQVCVSTDYKDLKCQEDAGNPGKRLFMNSYRDTFRITVEGNQVCARRTDYRWGGWGLALGITCSAVVGACNCDDVNLQGKPWEAGQLKLCHGNCRKARRRSDDNSCPEGWKIFSPRSVSDWQTFKDLDLVSPDSTWGLLNGQPLLVDVTKPESGRGSSGSGPMNSANPQREAWSTSDGSPWWLRESYYSEPNGDYFGSCYLAVGEIVDVHSIKFNDWKCNHAATNYFCQPKVQRRMTILP